MMLAASRIDPEAAFVVPERFSVGKRNLMAALGAEIVNTPAGEGMGDVIDHTREMADSRANAVVLRQFVIPPNPRPTTKTTGPEVHDALDGEVGAVVMDCGTAGTLTGTARNVLEQDPDARAVAVEPEWSVSSAALGEGPRGGRIRYRTVPACDRAAVVSETAGSVVTVVFRYGEVAHFGGDDGVSERPLPLADCASLSPEISDFRE